MDAEVKKEVEDFTEIIAQTIANCIESHVNYSTVCGSYKGLIVLKSRRMPVSREIESDTIMQIHTSGSTYISAVSNLGSILKSWMDEGKEININVEKLKKIKKLRGNSITKLHWQVKLYKTYFEDLLLFSKGKGFLTKEKFKAEEGDEVIPDAFRHVKEAE